MNEAESRISDLLEQVEGLRKAVESEYDWRRKAERERDALSQKCYRVMRERDDLRRALEQALDRLATIISVDDLRWDGMTEELASWRQALSTDHRNE